MTGMELVHVPGLGQSQGARDDTTNDDPGPQDAGPSGKDWRLLRRAMIADMLLRRVPERAMARDLGCSKTTVHRECEKIRAEWRARHAEKFDAHVAESLAILDRGRSVVLGILLDAGASQSMKLAAHAELRQAEESRRRLLGLDKPTKIEATVHVDLEAEKDRGRRMVDEVARKREERAG